MYARSSSAAAFARAFSPLTTKVRGLPPASVAIGFSKLAKCWGMDARAAAALSAVMSSATTQPVAFFLPLSAGAS